VPSAGTTPEPVRTRLAQRWSAARYWSAYGRQRAAAGWLLRHAGTGAQPTVIGWPTVEATDLVVGDHFRICSNYRRTFISGWGRIRIGDRVFINSGVVLFSALEIEIGDDVAIANEAYLTDTDSHGVEGRPARHAPVRIGDGSWVGARAIVLPGVSIGRRCVVGAGAVVTADVPHDTLVGGNPARPLRPLRYPAGVVRAWHDG
jgi:acetyltransferase-like isoleucine patch superfamily enzyme